MIPSKFVNPTPRVLFPTSGGQLTLDIKRQAQSSEGLTAVYRLAYKISTSDAGQPCKHLACIGLSDGFGIVTMGQVLGTSFNATGIVTDNSVYYGNSEFTCRLSSPWL